MWILILHNSCNKLLCTLTKNLWWQSHHVTLLWKTYVMFAKIIITFAKPCHVCKIHITFAENLIMLLDLQVESDTILYIFKYTLNTLFVQTKISEVIAVRIYGLLSFIRRWMNTAALENTILTFENRVSLFTYKPNICK